MDLLPGVTLAPNLYDLGETLQEWAASVLALTNDDQLIVVGCSIGGSCALEVAGLAPDRVAALVLVGAKAGHRPQPEIHDDAIRILRDDGFDALWECVYAPLFSAAIDPVTALCAAAHRQGLHIANPLLP